MPQVLDAAESRVQRCVVSALRLILGLGCTVSEVTAGAERNAWLAAAAITFAIYGLAVLLAGWKRRTGGGLLSLVVDTIFFLVFAAYGIDTGGWLVPALYFFLLLSSLLLHRWWDTWLIASISVLLLAFFPSNHAGTLWKVVFWTGLLACIAAYIQSVILRRLAESAREAQQYRALVAQSRDAERQKLAGDFHDGPLQGFISMQMRLEVLKRILDRDPAAARRELEDLQQASRSHINEMRAFLRGIRPVEVGEAGLAASIRQTVAEFQRHSGIKTTFQTSGAPTLPSEESSREVVQIAREALSNVQKHSGATRVAVTLAPAHEGLEMSVEDNGGGFPFAGTFRLDEMERLRIGPASIRTRVRSLGGELTVESRPQRGSHLTIWVPA